MSERKRDDVAQMFDSVARRYDLLNDVLSVGQDRRWRKALLQAVDPQPGMRILDLAAGTGTSTQPFSDAGAEVVAVDISLGMLIVGQARLPGERFVNADALKLPFGDDTFDVVTISFGLRNIIDVPAALVELRRVTAPGGKLVVCEFSTPKLKPFRAVYQQYLKRVLPNLAKLSTSNPDAYRYLTDSILAWPDQTTLAGIIRDAGWHQVAWKNLTNGIVALHRATK
ncbi:MAG: demethylmenaquinone methyltransferase [Propionibacteriaceae bacterium]|jgi:demethylmenaquinone methyltransferase/2-methoxy-6-polyprenyl-1,4-benzoquinol methylase|nr:demethylmenaquinone methyltransferase [Propionibacteriaceae bacterium]